MKMETTISEASFCIDLSYCFISMIDQYYPGTLKYQIAWIQGTACDVN